MRAGESMKTIKAFIKRLDIRQYRKLTPDDLLVDLGLPEDLQAKLIRMLWDHDRHSPLQIKELIDCSDTEILQIRGIDKKKLLVIQTALYRHGLPRNRSSL